MGLSPKVCRCFPLLLIPRLYLHSSNDPFPALFRLIADAYSAVQLAPTNDGDRRGGRRKIKKTMKEGAGKGISLPPFPIPLKFPSSPAPPSPSYPSVSFSLPRELGGVYKKGKWETRAEGRENKQRVEGGKGNSLGRGIPDFLGLVIVEGKPKVRRKVLF